MRAFSAAHDDYSNLEVTRKLITFMGTVKAVQTLPAEDLHTLLLLITIISRRADNRACLATEGGIGVVLHAMRAHADSLPVQKQACAAIWNLVVHSSSNRVRVASRGGVQIIAAALKKFPKESGLVRLAVAVLASLSAESTWGYETKCWSTIDGDQL